MKTRWTCLALMFPLGLAACASSTAPTQDRGWIGGRFADVSREHEPEITNHHHGDIVGMPESASGDHGALVTAAYQGTPLACAGLAPGDLVLTIDGTPVNSGLALREHAEAMTPGARSTVTYWRAGEIRSADVVVGKETYRGSGRFALGLGLSLTLDLWPFDDGVNLFDLVRVQWDHERNDVVGPVSDYRRAVDPETPVEGPLQEATDVWIVLVGVAKGKSVVSQETLQ